MLKYATTNHLGLLTVPKMLGEQNTLRIQTNNLKDNKKAIINITGPFTTRRDIHLHSLKLSCMHHILPYIGQSLCILKKESTHRNCCDNKGYVHLWPPKTLSSNHLACSRSPNGALEMLTTDHRLTWLSVPLLNTSWSWKLLYLTSHTLQSKHTIHEWTQNGRAQLVCLCNCA